eukprot:7280811-Pyramimonas_sp.AAC.1
MSVSSSRYEASRVRPGGVWPCVASPVVGGNTYVIVRCVTRRMPSLAGVYCCTSDPLLTPF